MEQLTYPVFLKMADEYAGPLYRGDVGIPKGFDWTSLTTRRGAELEAHYVALLLRLGQEKVDVTVRLSNGPYRYLTVVECKNEKAKVPVRGVDAFVTKSQDIHANKAVMVSTSGYQSGGAEVAKRHGVVLLNLVERSDAEPRAGDLSVVTKR